MKTPNYFVDRTRNSQLRKKSAAMHHGIVTIPPLATTLTIPYSMTSVSQRNPPPPPTLSAGGHYPYKSRFPLELATTRIRAEVGEFVRAKGLFTLSASLLLR